jgi:hypothetical protein
LQFIGVEVEQRLDDFLVDGPWYAGLRKNLIPRLRWIKFNEG